MENIQLQIAHYVNEYESLVANNNQIKSIDWTTVKSLLHNEHDWTTEGAAILADLAQNYGSFILSHALALAITLQQEDGKLGL